MSDRRAVLRTAALAAFGSLFGRFDAFAMTAQARGRIEAPLDQWRFLIFTFGGRQVTVPTADVFKALEEAYGSTPVGGSK